MNTNYNSNNNNNETLYTVNGDVFISKVSRINVLQNVVIEFHGFTQFASPPLFDINSRILFIGENDVDFSGGISAAQSSISLYYASFKGDCSLGYLSVQDAIILTGTTSSTTTLIIENGVNTDPNAKIYLQENTILKISGKGGSIGLLESYDTKWGKMVFEQISEPLNISSVQVYYPIVIDNCTNVNFGGGGGDDPNLYNDIEIHKVSNVMFFEGSHSINSINSPVNSLVNVQLTIGQAGNVTVASNSDLTNTQININPKGMLYLNGFFYVSNGGVNISSDALLNISPTDKKKTIEQYRFTDGISLQSGSTLQMNRARVTANITMQGGSSMVVVSSNLKGTLLQPAMAVLNVSKDNDNYFDDHEALYTVNIQQNLNSTTNVLINGDDIPSDPYIKTQSIQVNGDLNVIINSKTQDLSKVQRKDLTLVTSDNKITGDDNVQLIDIALRTAFFSVTKKDTSISIKIGKSKIEGWEIALIVCGSILEELKDELLDRLKHEPTGSILFRFPGLLRQNKEGSKIEELIKFISEATGPSQSDGAREFGFITLSNLYLQPQHLFTPYLPTLKYNIEQTLKQPNASIKVLVKWIGVLGKMDLYLWSISESDPYHEDTPHGFAITAMATFIDQLGEPFVKTFLNKILPSLLNSKIWQERYSGLMGLLIVNRHRCILPVVLDWVKKTMPLYNDPVIYVRWAFIHYLGEMVTLGYGFIRRLEPLHDDIIQNIVLKGIRDSNPRIQDRSCRLLTSIIKDVDSTLISNRKTTLLNYLLPLLTSPTVYVAESALETFTAIIDSEHFEFGAYYDSVMPFLINIIRVKLDVKYRLIRGLSMESISLLAVEVGKDRFKEDFFTIFELIQSQNLTLDLDDPQIEYFLSSFTRFCQCFGLEFIPYLGFIMPLFFQVINSVTPEPLKEPIQREIENEMSFFIKSTSQQQPQQSLPFKGVRKINHSLLTDIDKLVGTTPQYSDEESQDHQERFEKREDLIEKINQDKALALSLLKTYANELEEYLFPYVEKYTGDLLKMTNHKETILKHHATYLIPSLLKISKCYFTKVKFAPQPLEVEFIKKLYYSIVQTLFKALPFENDAKVINTKLFILKDVYKFMQNQQSPYFEIVIKHFYDIFKVIKTIYFEYVDEIIKEHTAENGSGREEFLKIDTSDHVDDDDDDNDIAIITSAVCNFSDLFMEYLKLQSKYLFSQDKPIPLELHSLSSVLVQYTEICKKVQNYSISSTVNILVWQLLKMCNTLSEFLFQFIIPLIIHQSNFTFDELRIETYSILHYAQECFPDSFQKYLILAMENIREKIILRKYDLENDNNNENNNNNNNNETNNNNGSKNKKKKKKKKKQKQQQKEEEEEEDEDYYFEEHIQKEVADLSGITTMGFFMVDCPMTELYKDYISKVFTEWLDYTDTRVSASFKVNEKRLVNSRFSFKKSDNSNSKNSQGINGGENNNNRSHNNLNQNDVFPHIVYWGEIIVDLVSKYGTLVTGLEFQNLPKIISILSECLQMATFDKECQKRIIFILTSCILPVLGCLPKISKQNRDFILKLLKRIPIVQQTYGSQISKLESIK
eukprot:gene4206-5268_t